MTTFSVAQVRAALNRVHALSEDFPNFPSFRPGEWATPEEEAKILKRIDEQNMATMRVILEASNNDAYVIEETP